MADMRLQKMHEKIATNEEDITKLSLQGLKVLLERQKRILNNKYLMSVLPDNGAKVRDKADQIQALILSKESFQQVTDRLSRLGVGEDSIASSTVLGQRSHLVTVLQGGIDSDDEGDCVGGDGDNDGVISSENDVVDMDDGHPPPCSSDKPKNILTVKELQGRRSERSDEEKISLVRSRLKTMEVKKARMLTIEESLLIQQEQKKREEEYMSERAVARLLESAGNVYEGLPDSTAQHEFRWEKDDSADDSNIDTEDEDDDNDGGDDIIGEVLNL